MTVAELIRELQDAMDPDAQVYFTAWQRRCTTRRKIRSVHPCGDSVYLFAGRDDYLPMIDRILDIMLARGLNADDADARAVVEAMRGPTIEMMEACVNCGGIIATDEVEIFPARVWNAMLDAALNE